MARGSCPAPPRAGAALGAPGALRGSRGSSGLAGGGEASEPGGDRARIARGPARTRATAALRGRGLETSGHGRGAESPQEPMGALSPAPPRPRLRGGSGARRRPSPQSPERTGEERRDPRETERPERRCHGRVRAGRDRARGGSGPGVAAVRLQPARGAGRPRCPGGRGGSARWLRTAAVYDRCGNSWQNELRSPWSLGKAGLGCPGSWHGQNSRAGMDATAGSLLVTSLAFLFFHVPELTLL